MLWSKRALPPAHLDVTDSGLTTAWSRTRRSLCQFGLHALETERRSGPCWQEREMCPAPADAVWSAVVAVHHVTEGDLLDPGAPTSNSLRSPRMSVAQRTIATWEQRFRAPISFLPEWSPAAPDRCVYNSSEAGIWQLFAWNRSSGERRQVTESAVGIVDGAPTFDGEGVLWFDDETGDESGRWLVQPFAGGEIRPFIDDVPHGWNLGLAQALGIVAVAIASRDGFGVYVSLEGAPGRELHRSSSAVAIGYFERGFIRSGLSADGSLLCLHHTEHGDVIHPALRVVDPLSAEVVAEELDERRALILRCWSPVAGDQRAALEHERAGERRPALWDLATGEREDLDLELRGEIHVEDWWPDASALLLKQLHEGRHRLFRLDLATREVEQVSREQGMIWSARVRPDGSVWLVHEQGHRRRRVLDDTGAEVLPLPANAEPAAREYESWHFLNEHGDRVHGFYVRPNDSGGPFPVVMFVHGGPTALDMDRWQPEVQAYVDAGFAVGLVNYRGSSGYGSEWRDVLIGNIGEPELEDVNAGLSDLVERGVADASQAVIAGYSWGGYVTLLELGKHSDLWICGIAGVPIGDYEAGYQQLSPLLQVYDRALLGGATPADVPDLMRERNPINFADNVRAPVLFLIGRNDSRCPFDQAMRYVDKLADRGHAHEMHVFPTGHSPFDIDERVRQVRKILDFLERCVATPTDPAAAS
jgi:dienelactone hydrolase